MVTMVLHQEITNYHLFSGLPMVLQQITQKFKWLAQDSKSPANLSSQIIKGIGLFRSHRRVPTDLLVYRTLGKSLEFDLVI
jgi:hypothetical protein